MAVWAVLVLSTAQMTCAYLVLASTLALGGTLSERGAQLTLLCAFSAAGALLHATSRDSRTLPLLAWFAAIGSLFGRSAVHGLPETWYAPVDVLFRGVALEALAPACLWRFALGFPRVERFAPFDVLAGRVTTTCWVLGVVLFGLNLFGAYYSIEVAAIGVFAHGHSSNVYWHVVILTLLPAVGAIFVRSRRAPLPERQKVARFAVTIAGGIAPLLLLAVVLTVSPAANRWLAGASPMEHLWLDWVVIGGLAAMPLLSSLAVIVDRPFELQAILQPTSVYAAARGLITVLVLSPFTAFCILLYQQRHTSIADVFSSFGVVPLILCAATGSVLLATRSRMLNALDRRLSRRAVGHQQQLARALDRVRLARGPREVVGVLQQELRRGTGADTVRLLLPGAVGGFTDPSQTITPLPLDSGLIAILRETTAPVDVSADGDLRALLPSHDRAWVTTCDVALVAALKHRDETIAAVVVFGPKHGGLPFDKSDQWLTTTLTSAAAAAWSDDDATERRGTQREPHTREDEAAFECPRCGVVSDAVTLPCQCQASAVLAALPARLGSTFVVHRRLGAGGMGVVYLAHDRALEREVALKTLPALAPGAVARLQDEARAMASLNHETLATIYELALWRRTPVLVVEYLPNGTLARRLVEGPLSPRDTIDLGIRLARALAFMHAKGMLHRDLKPSNVGFTATGLPKLLDFGLAVLIAPASRGGEGSRPDLPPGGTAAYVPPEAYRGVPPGPAFDLWALSVVLLEAASGANPFAGGTRLSTAHHVADLSSFFERALDRRPEQRFQTASQMSFALETLASR